MHFTCCDFITDCVQNSVEADAKFIHVSVTETADIFSVRIEDNGKGMDREGLVRARDPFYSSGGKHVRRVGLGLPFLVQAVELCGGDFALESEPGRGTDLAFTFDLGHVDAPPVGDVPGTFLHVLCFEGDYEMEILRGLRDTVRETEYRLVRTELAAALGDLTGGASLKLLKEYLRSQEFDT